MSTVIRIKITLCLCLLLSLAVPGWSQVTNASLTGLITDMTGAVVPNASVTATQTSTHLEQKSTTGSAGYYLFPALLVGTYTVTVEVPGFKKGIHNNVVLGVGQRVRNDFTLEVGSITQHVEVKGTAITLQLEDASPGMTIQKIMVLDIPTGRRNWDDLLLLAAGVGGDRYTEQTGSTAAGRTGGVSVNGVRSLQNNFILDGIDNNTISENVQELSTQVVHTSLDAIDEFKIITDPYSTEYGRSPGAAVIVATKAGTNTFHGTAWEFVRNDKFDAADFFTNLAGSKKAEYRQNQFGGNIGGPIRKDHAFFFFNYEGTRRVQGSPILTTIPTASERSGDFSASAAALNGTTYAPIYDPVGDCVAKAPSAFSASDPLGPTHFANNQIPSICLDTVAQRLINLFPLPDLTPAAAPYNANNWFQTPGLLDDNDTITSRVDWQPGTNHRVFVRYNWQYHYHYTPGTFTGVAWSNGSSSHGIYTLPAQQAAIGYDWVITPRMLNEVRIGWGRNNSSAKQPQLGIPAYYAATFGVLGVATDPTFSGGLPNTYIGGGGGMSTINGGVGGSMLGVPDFLPKWQKTNQFQWVDTISLTRGTHWFKWGADIHAPMRNIFRDIPGVRGGWAFFGQFTGIPFGDWLMGYPAMAWLTSPLTVDQRLWMVGFFFQDVWKATPKLTVNYGLRYDFATWPYSASNAMLNLNPANGQAFTPANSPFGRGLIKPDKHNFGPRLGLAYHVRPNWVLRAGYGRFYQQLDRQGSEDMLALNLPYLVNNNISTGSSTVPVNNMRIATGFNLSLDPATVSRSSVVSRTANPENVMPSVDQWSVGLQRMFAGNMVLSLDYVGTKGTHLSILENGNENTFNPDGTPTGYAPFAAYGWGLIQYRDNAGNSTYHSLQATLEKPISHGLTVHGAYTYSHMIDEQQENLYGGASGYYVANRYNRKGTSRGNSDMDNRHRLSVGYVYEIPTIPSLASSSASGAAHALRQVMRDWRLSGMTSYRTGGPFTVTAGGIAGQIEGPYAGLISVTADCLGNGALSRSARNRVEWFNTGAFALQSPPRLGTCGRNTLTGPPFTQFDFSISRSFKFGEQRRLEARWDVLNAFNTPHFGYPDNDVTSSTFGTITSLAGDPRAMQFALQFYF
jgi:outer membrane receptor protein involved in Fe transport